MNFSEDSLEITQKIQTETCIGDFNMNVRILIFFYVFPVDTFGK